jgi:hypothetical protein
MKKLVIIILLLGFISSTAVIALTASKGFGFISDLFNNGLAINEVETDDSIQEISDILNESELDQNQEFDFEFTDEDLFGDSTEEPDKPKRLSVVPSIRAAKVFENAFIRFSHPSYIEIKNLNINFLEIWNDEEEMIGTINVYSNPEGLSLEEFVKKDNLVDYFTESQARGIESSNFDIPTAETGVKFNAYPELKTADIYLIKFNDSIILAKDYSEDKVVGEYLLRSMEKVR